jgi:glutathione S-transferase
MILYDYILSASCYKVRLLAALLDVPLTLRAVNFHPAQDHKSPEMRQLNPAGTLPVLVDGAVVYTQSADMLRYLATQSNLAWLGTDSAQTDRWLDFATSLNASLGMARLHDVLSFPGDITALRQTGVARLRIMEAWLAEQRFDGMAYLTGAAPTIADIACFPNVALAPDGGVSLDPYPSIRLWMRAIRSLPAFIEMPGIHRLHELSPAPVITP